MTSPGIGERLRSAREARGLSLEEIEAGTRIRRRYLEALEAEAFDEIPGPAYVKGFLRTYAIYLGFSPDDLAALSPEIGAETIITPAPAVEVRITPVTRRSSMARIILGIGLVVAIGVALVGYVLYGQVRQFATTRPPISSGSHPVSPPARPGGTEGTRPVPGATASPAPGSPPPVVLPSPVPPPPTRPPAPKTPPAIPSPAVTPKPAAPPPAAPQPAESASPGTPRQGPQGSSGGAIVFTGPLQVVAVATDRAWVRVVADGVLVFEGYMSAGTRQAWEAKREITLKVGNASGLEVSVNGQPLGRLGNPGDVVDRTFRSGDSGNP